MCVWGVGVGYVGQAKGNDSPQVQNMEIQLCTAAEEAGGVDEMVSCGCTVQSRQAHVVDAKEVAALHLLGKMGVWVRGRD